MDAVRRDGQSTLFSWDLRGGLQTQSFDPTEYCRGHGTRYEPPSLTPRIRPRELSTSRARTKLPVRSVRTVSVPRDTGQSSQPHDPSSAEERTRQRVEDKTEPLVETGTGKGTDRESAAEMKSETGERIEKGRAEGRQEPLMAISSRAILFPFARKFLALKCLVLYGVL
jgi:hypothetical protein